MTLALLSQGKHNWQADNMKTQKVYQNVDKKHRVRNNDILGKQAKCVLLKCFSL